MVESRAARIFLRLGAGATLAFIYFPLVVIAIYAFNENISQTWPIESYTTKWFSVAWNNPDVRDALWLSVKAASGATVIALVLGTLAGLAVSRSRFFGREVISFLVILPIALPGIVTGLALQATILNVLDPIGIGFSIWTIVIGHATFCIVVLYNNAVARMRRVSGNLDEASMDLGADGWQTFRFVTFPVISTALVSGALLAFALSFDEVIVTTFTAGAQNTLPLWIFGKIRLGQQLPQVNVVVAVIIALTIIPVYLAQRLSRESGILRRE
jgi:putative spermidine/putrescine transport system permease protein